MTQDQNFDALVSIPRIVSVRENGIELRTRFSEGYTYAYYLTHRKKKLTKAYTDSTSFLFEIEPKPGIYEATFFYRKDNKARGILVDFYIDAKRNVSIINKTKIASEPGYKIDFYDQGAETTFIVFNGAGSHLTSTPFGLNFLISRGYNVITCLQNNDQYQSLSFNDFERLVRPVVERKQVFLYGSSLGGYCALYYAGAVNGHVIAAAPRNSAHPKLIERAKGKTRFQAEQFQHKSLTENRTSEGAIHVFIDPHSKNDVFFLNEVILPAYKDITLLEFPHAGHEVLLHVNKTRQLQTIIRGIINNKSTLDINYSIDSEVTEIGKARFHLFNKNHNDAADYAQRALSRGVTNKVLMSRLQAVVNVINRTGKRVVISSYLFFYEYDPFASILDTVI